MDHAAQREAAAFDTRRVETEGATLPRARPQVEGAASAGDTVGRYIVLGKIGEGGMGEVYAAYDPKLDRKVALKLLHAGLAGNTTGSNMGTADAGARLLREAQALAKLDHRHVVAAYDAGTFNDDVFMAMALVPGQTLREWVKHESPPWREILRMFIQAGEGLAAAHEAGLVHRDFKPDNAIVDEGGHVRVLDFGLVHATQPANASHDRPRASIGQGSIALPRPEDIRWGDSATGGEKPLLGVPDPIDLYLADEASEVERPSFASTEFVSVLGTPGYMAPEQHDAEVTTPRSDQFSFCVALYEALYRQHPFAWGSRNEISASLDRGVVAPTETHCDAGSSWGSVSTRRSAMRAWRSCWPRFGVTPRRRVATWL